MRLTTEAFRIVKPGGYVALNYRTWVPADGVLVPAGIVMRQLWRIPVLGPRLSQWRWSTRFGWQANRLDPKRILTLLETAGVVLDDIAILHHPGKPQGPVTFKGSTVIQRDLDVANKSHWWLVARCH
jgi:hypothetical protein